MAFALPDGSESPRAATLAASVARMRGWLPWLSLGAAVSCAWTAYSAGLGDLVPTLAAGGIVVLLFYTAVAWGDWREIGVGALVSAVGVMGWVGGRLATEWLPGWMDTLGAGGWALLAFLAYVASTRTHETARLGGGVVVLSATLMLLSPTALAVALATSAVLPRTWDAPALILDESFPIHAFHVGRWLAGAHGVRAVASFVYDGIYVFIPALVALRLRLPKPPPVEMLAICAFVCLVGQIGYYVTPVMGPAFAFQANFPADIPPIRDLPTIALWAPPYLRNALPSLHTAWALVVLWNTRLLSLPIRAAGAAVVFFTVVATLGFGQHYVIDLVAAVPYAAVAQASATHVYPRFKRARRRLMAAGALLTLAWILAPRIATSIAIQAPWLIVLGSVVTVVSSLAGEHWISRCGVQDV